MGLTKKEQSPVLVSFLLYNAKRLRETADMFGNGQAY